MDQIKVYIWEGCARQRLLGAGHAGVDVDWKGEKFYITWLTSSGDKKKASDLVGFEYVWDAKNDMLRRNPRAWYLRPGGGQLRKSVPEPSKMYYPKKKLGDDVTGDDFIEVSPVEGAVPKTRKKTGKGTASSVDEDETYQGWVYQGRLTYEQDCVVNAKRMKLPKGTIARASDEIAIRATEFELDELGWPLYIWGLDAKGIMEWWRRVMQREPRSIGRRYEMLSKKYNCDAMVREALRAGGGAVYAPPPRTIKYQGSTTLKQWAKNIQSRVNELTRQYQDLMLFGEMPDRWGRPGAWVEVPSVDAWKKRSAVSGEWRRMTPELVKVDDLVKRYNDKRRQLRHEEELSFLAAVQGQVYKLFKRKPSSRRLPAMKELFAAAVVHMSKA